MNQGSEDHPARRTVRILLTVLTLCLWLPPALATNPLIMDQFTADPTARVFDGKLYVYPSHDIKAPPDYKGRPNWFVMEDYHVFSSSNLTDWKDHGVIVTQTKVPWADPAAYSMWAPDCVYHNGKYYFYFPATAKSGGFRIGVAVSDRPDGPFIPEPDFIQGVQGIDPSVFIDKDGSAYLYYSLNKIYVARLKPNMREIEGEPRVIDNLPTKGLLEGPFVFERRGTYYLTYPHVENKTERLEYATSSSPLGPFTQRGVFLDESESGCWTVHHSLVDFQGQWYLFYHDKDLSPSFDKNRAIRADKLYFEPDGSIRKVIPTLRGVGRVAADSTVQIDRYSARSAAGTEVSFLDAANPHAGWKVALAPGDSWVRFNEVEFGRGGHRVLEARARSAAGGTIEIRADKAEGPLLARLVVGQGQDWRNVDVRSLAGLRGVHDLFIRHVGGETVDVDWLRFR